MDRDEAWRWRRPWIIGGAAVAAVALVAGGLYLFRPGGGATDLLTGQDVAALRVTGTAPGASTFAAGAKQAWHLRSPNGGSVDVVSGQDESMLVAAGDSNTTYLLGITTATGEQSWRKTVSGVLTCAPTALEGSAYCYESSGSGTAAADLLRISLSDGSVQKQVGLPAQGAAMAGVERIGVFDRSIVVVQYLSAEDYTASAVVRRLPADLSSITWSTTVEQPRQSNAASTWADVARVRSGVLALSDGFADMTLDFSTGKVISADTYGTTEVEDDGTIVAQGDDVKGSSASGRRIVKASSDHTVLVDFSWSADAPPAPLFATVEDDGTVSVDAYRDDGSTPLWKSPVTSSGSDQLFGVYGASERGRLVLVDSAGHITSVDPSTGAMQWSNSYAAPPRTDGGASYTEPQPFFADANTLFVADFDSTGTTPEIHAFNAFTGESLWTLNDTRLVNAPTADSNAVVVYGLDGIGPLVGAAAAPKTVPTVSGLPACPSGMSAIMWSTYPGGHVLLCQGEKRYRVMLTIANKAVGCSALDFTSGGYRLTCKGNTSVAISGGGAMLQFGSGSTTWTQPASAAWSAAGTAASTATGFGASPDRIPVVCPAGTYTISVSTWHQGWLLICGTDALHVMSFVYRTSGSNVTGSTMSYTDGRYCGVDSEGTTVCASSTPSLVSLTGKDGSTRQFSADANYFASTGLSGVGQNTGAYGVKAPEDTAEDEVRYLVQILQKSEQGRQEVGDLVANLLRCQISAHDTSTAASVVSNRQDLLSALASTPVDKVPNGSRLVAELTEALSVSLQADQQYQTAANQMASGDCSTGLATAKSAIAVADTTDALKQTFVDDWNSSIAGKYSSAPVFDSGKI